MTATLTEPETTTTLAEYWLGRAMVYRAEIQKMQKGMRRLRRRADRQKTLEIENAELRKRLRIYMGRVTVQ